MRYVSPPTLEAVVQALATIKQARVIAGGTDLVPLMRAREAEMSLLIDLRHVPLRYIEKTDGILRLGACTTHTDLLRSELVAELFPALKEAAREIAAPPVRNRGTLGGNLANASPAADLAPPLLAYDARIVRVTVEGERECPLDGFFKGPGQCDLEPDELIKEIRLPLPPPNTASTFIKLGKRRAMAIAVVNVAVRLTVDRDGVVRIARIALGSVAPIPMRARGAEAVLEAQTLSAEALARSADKASREASPISDLRASAEYRRKMVRVLVYRALDATWRQIREGGKHGQD